MFGLLSILYVFQVKCECDSLRGAECSYFPTESDGCTPVDRNAFPLCIQPYMYSIIVTTKTIEISWKPENCGGYITYNISVSSLLWVPFFSSVHGRHGKRLGRPTQRTWSACHWVPWPAAAIFRGCFDQKIPMENRTIFWGWSHGNTVPDDVDPCLKKGVKNFNCQQDIGSASQELQTRTLCSSL